MDLVINKKTIQTPIIDMLFKLRDDLNEVGISKLAVIQNKGDNARITCPSHKEGRENHPSCSVLLTDTKDLPQGFVSCFTCGYRATFPKFVSDCFGVHDNGEFGENWILENFDYAFNTDIRVLPKLDVHIRTQKSRDSPVQYVSEEELASYRFYHPYMWKRKLTPEIVDKFDIGFDKKTNSITFPVYDDKGRCLFVIKRNVNIKYFQIPEGITKYVFGLNQITPDINKVIICESVINALTCWVYGKPAVALFGTGTKEEIDQLINSHVRYFVLGFDGDNAGRKATVKFRNALSKTKIVTEYHLPEGKDINDLSKEEFDNLIEF